MNNLENEKKYEKGSKKLNIILVFIAFIALIFYMAWKDGILDIAKVFANCNVKWLWLGLAIMAFCWFIESYIVNIGLNIFNKKLNFKESAKNCILGQFFSNLTPSATGGQPFQAFYMKKCGINYGTSVSVLLIKFICFQIALTIVCGMFIILNFKDLTQKNQNCFIIIVTSFFINLIIVAILFLIAFYEKIAISITHITLKLLKKLKLIKNSEQKFEKTKLEIEFFKKNFKLIFKNKKTIAYILILTIIQILSFHSINVAIALVFNVNLNFNKIYNILSNASYINLSSIFVPLPGAIGGAEISYYVFYNQIFEAKTLSAALLLWRIYSFYIPILLGLFCYNKAFKKP